jgi:hypothetical protein
MSISQSELQKLAALASRSQDEANLILKGEIIDSWLLKILINIENKTGAMMVLVSELSLKVVSIYSIFGTSPGIRKIRTFEKFQQFATDMGNAIKEGGMEAAVSERIGRTLYRTLLPEDLQSVLPDFDLGQLTNITDLITKGVAQETKLMNIQVELDIERINSAEFAKKNPIYGMVSEVRSPFEAAPTNSSTPNTSSRTQTTTSTPKTKIEIAVDDFVKDYKEVIKCSTVVSPVSGVLFDELKPGQKLLFMLPFKTSDEKSRARRLGAVNKLGQNGPVIGEFVKLIMGKDEFHLFAKGPHNTLLRAFEERPVRLAVPKAKDYEQEEERNIKSIVMVALGFLLFVLLLFFFYFR